MNGDFLGVLGYVSIFYWYFRWAPMREDIWWVFFGNKPSKVMSEWISHGCICSHGGKYPASRTFVHCSELHSIFWILTSKWVQSVLRPNPVRNWQIVSTNVNNIVGIGGSTTNRWLRRHGQLAPDGIDCSPPERLFGQQWHLRI